MTLGDFLHSEQLDTFAWLPAEMLPVTKPRLLEQIPQARTVLLAAIPYRMAGDSNLAQFARCLDYHAYARELGARCAACLAAEFPGCSAVAFADHSPYAEVRSAAMAGLGLRGDNGLLITERYASYVFIFELVTTLTEEQMRTQNIPRGTGVISECAHCGACRRACPGGCTGGDRSRCISAISQKKGALTEEETELLRHAQYTWGCDVCQDVCPHAKSAAETPIPYFRNGRLGILTEEKTVAMAEEEYTSYAFGWRKKEIMLRNLRLRKERDHD